MPFKPWYDINSPYNPFEAKNADRDAADRKNQEKAAAKADAEAESAAYSNQFTPELTDPAWSHADESRAKESPDSALIGDTLLLSAKSKDIVAGASVNCFVRDFSADAPWLTERKLPTRVGNDDTVQVEWVVDENDNDSDAPEFKFWFETRKADSTIEASTSQTPIPLGKRQAVDWIEIPDLLYNDGSALPMPGESWELAGILTLAADKVRQAAGSSLLACGHASDADEGLYSTLEVSRWRATAIKAIFDNDEKAWLEAAHDFSYAKDVQQYLVGVSALWGKAYHPGAVDGKIGPKTKTAIQKYKKCYNQKFKANLADSDAIDDDFLRSILGLYRSVVTNRFKQATGETALPNCAWAHDGKGIFACGTSFKPGADAASKSGARVELFLLTDAATPVIADPPDDKSPPSAADISLYGKGFDRTRLTPEHGEIPASQNLAVHFIALGGGHFNSNCALPVLDAKGELIASLAQAFAYAKEHADSELIVEGHADASGDAKYNLAISKRRAESIRALLGNDAAMWNGVVKADGADHKIEPEDYKASFKTLADKYGWSCDPGVIDNSNDARNKETVKKFQLEFKKRFGKDLNPGGIMESTSWEAMFLVFRSLLENYCAFAHALDPLPDITYGYAEGNGVYPCGECCPVEGSEDKDASSEKNRRVELVFYGNGEADPAVAPAADRTIGQDNDPVTGKSWDKEAIALAPIQDMPVLKFSTSESKAPPYWDPFLTDAPKKILAVFSIKGNFTGDIKATLLKEDKEIMDLPIASKDSGSVKVEWTGLDASGARVSEGAYAIRAHLVGKGSPISTQASDVIRLIRIGVTEISFQESYPLKIYYDKREAGVVKKSVDFDIPDPQWKMSSLNDDANAKPRELPQPSLDDESKDPNNYNYPICCALKAKSPVAAKISGKGFGKADALSVTLKAAKECTSTDNKDIQPDKTVHFDGLAKEIESIDKKELTLTFTFTHTAADGSVVQVGTFPVPKITLFTTASMPQEPWNNDTYSGGSNLWLSVLELLCTQWANGQKTADGAAGQITDKIFSSGFKYDTVRGESKFTSGWSGANLKSWLYELTLSEALRKPMNCTDCATILTCLANALGSELYSSRFEHTIKDGFDCHKIISIGFSNWDYPFPDPSHTSGGFSYHEIGWKNSCDETEPIFDPCLKTATDPVKAPEKNALLPVNIIFDIYKPKLVVPKDVKDVKPMKGARIRRSVS
jgi:hypothetical protein